MSCHICLQVLRRRCSAEDETTLRSDNGKSNFANNFTVLRFSVNRAARPINGFGRCGGGDDDDSPPHPLPVSYTRAPGGFLSKSENRDYWFIAISACGIRFCRSLFLFHFFLFFSVVRYKVPARTQKRKVNFLDFFPPTKRDDDNATEKKNK